MTIQLMGRLVAAAARDRQSPPQQVPLRRTRLPTSWPAWRAELLVARMPETRSLSAMAAADDVQVWGDAGGLGAFGSDANGVYLDRRSDNRCSTYFIKEPVSASDVPPAVKSALGTDQKLFYLQPRNDPGSYLAASFGRPGDTVDATTDFTLGAATASKDQAMMFFEKSYPAGQDLPANVLLAFLPTSDPGVGSDGDPNLKAFCSGSVGPERVYQSPVACGGSFGPSFCALDWQSCNFGTGYCYDKNRLPSSAPPGQPPDPPSPNPDLLFPNCSTRAIGHVVPKSSEGCDPNPPPGKPPTASSVEGLEKAKDKKHLEEMVGIIGAVVLLLMFGAAIVLYIESTRSSHVESLRHELTRIEAEESGKGRLLTAQELLTTSFG